MKSKLDLIQLTCYQVEAKHGRNGSARLQYDPRRFPKRARLPPICPKMVTKWFQEACRHIQWASSDLKLTIRASQVTPRQSKMTLRAAMTAQDAPKKCPCGTPNRWKFKNNVFSKNALFPGVFQWKVVPESQEMMGKVPETSLDRFKWNVMVLDHFWRSSDPEKGGWNSKFSATIRARPTYLITRD